jgi:SRSO17 transposase
VTQQDQRAVAAASVDDILGARNRLRADVREILGRVLAQARSAQVAMDYIDGLLEEAAANCWALAERAGHDTPRRMQDLLGSYAWDWRDVRAELPGFAAQRLPCPDDDIAGPGLAIDETAHIKKGARTAGVARQHAGITGQVENCVTTVFCAYVTPGGHCWIDWEPYLTEAWADDATRRAEARIPQDVDFATKPDLAARIVKRQASSGKLGIRWVAADEVYGRSSRFRAACEDADLTYALAVPEDFLVATKAGAFRADELAALAEPTFERRSCGPGSKGPRCYDWALAATASPRHFLLIRRSASDPDDMAFFYCFTPEGTKPTMTLLITIAGRRWPAEQSFQLAKSVLGWDTSQARTWHAYQRHTALSALAMAILAAAQAQTNALAAAPAGPAQPPTPRPPPSPPSPSATPPCPHAPTSPAPPTSA